jgi:hypothetical protein
MILVASQSSVNKEGVRAEWDYARSVAREYDIKDYIIPINLDGVSSNSIMGLTGLAMLQFQNSWAHGLKGLLAKLIKDSVPKTSEDNQLSAIHWYFNRFATNNHIVSKKETFYSNWLALPKLPDILYVYEYVNEAQSKHIVKLIDEQCIFPVINHERYIITFESKLQNFISVNDRYLLFKKEQIQSISRIEINVTSIHKRRYNSNTFPNKQDASNFLVQLLQKAFHSFLVNRGLSTYELANDRLCYFYSKNDSLDVKAKYLYQGKQRTKQLTGVFEHEKVWHYAVSFSPRLRPEFCFSLKGHIIFSNEGTTIWSDKKAIQSARRKKGSRLYNAEWRDLLLSFLSSLSDNQIEFHVRITSEKNLPLSVTTIIFDSDRGYIDPRDQGRLVPIDDYEIESEEYEFDIDSALNELIANDTNEEII